MNEQELIEKYGYWGEHPRFPAADWRIEVLEEYTRRGYWTWVVWTAADTRGRGSGE